ncbi:Zinc finger RING/FYVE/PHD-type protein [Dioscorea alata]|uniref:Zinc finger RING/FYVE/PHD-type protein n=4 Tax=Dioscorea alata TaxID=55571 RepID=A0ACB7VL32_DIOAL|nr:Zinc finger RING/FYVE/PHD-type protein [Dioscorea alata]KAH7674767.1 Zinc finger RING/FYVE/PHD-type protein [Dioscorea alata]
MDVYLRRTAGNIGSSRKGSNLAGRDPKHEDKSIQHCNRIGCSTNLNYMKGGHLSNANKSNCSRSSFRSACSKALANMDDLEKPKCLKATFRSTCSKALAGSSSASFPNSIVLNKSHREQKSQLLSKGTSVTDSSSASSSSSRQDIQDLDSIDAQEQTQDETENGTTTSMTGNFQSLLRGADSLDSTQGCSTSVIRRLANGNTTSTSRSCRQKPGNINQDTSSSSAKSSVVSRSGTSKLVSQTPGAGSQRYGLKNLGCTSISDVLPTGWSSSNGGQGRMVESVRKRPSEGESSSGRGKGIIGSSSERRLGSQHSKISGPTSENLIAQEGLRNSNKPFSRGLSVRTQRGPVRDTRMRLSERGDNSTPHLGPLVIPQPHVYIQEDVPESPSRSFLLESPPPLSHDSFSSQGSSSRSIRNRLLATHSDNRGGHHFNMETTAEVLLALERIEHIEDLTFEQLMMLEMNLYLGGLSFQDQHRDMRMDIDNMSYEELLALEEKIGTVSTALSEEALSKCLKRSIYIRPTLASTVTACGDDIKCSICQEDYVSGEEIGSLACEHRYHVACIHQWLRLKNWCPICKSSAVASS